MSGHDIFISYAHADDEVPMGLERGWVTTFVEELRKVLRRRLGGAGPDIWMDHQLAANAIVQPTLMEKVCASRTLVLFMSPGYLASPWCQGELGEFLAHYASQGNSEPVFIVEMDQMERSRWHPRLQNLSAIPLWEKSIQDMAPRLLGYPQPKPDEQSPYWLRLNELAHLLATQLVVERARAPVARAAPVVWIADPTDDLFDAWSQLAAAVRQAGGELRPQNPGSYPMTSGEAYLNAVAADLDGARLLVQLLGPFAGRRPGAGAGETLSVSQLQAQAARASGLPFLQWREPGLVLDGVSDEQQRRLLTGAQACGREAFQQLVLEALTTPKPAAPLTLAPRSADPGASLAICVTGGARDQDLCEQVGRILEDLGQSAINSPPGPDPGESPAEFRQHCDELLGNSEGVILVYGQEPRSWVQGQFMRVRKLLAQQRPAQGIWGAVLDGPPSVKPPLGLASPGVMPLDCRSGPAVEPIRQFVDSLRGVSHG